MKRKEVVMTMFINTAKVINELSKGAIKITGDQNPNSGWNYIQVGTTRHPAEVAVRLSCNMDDNELIGTTLTIFERDIMDSVFSLLNDEEEDVTPAMIIRAYAGNPHKESTKDFQKKVENAMDKLTSLTIKIECEEQLNMMGMSTRNNDCIFEGSLMPVDKVVTEESGGKKVVYHLEGTPVLYQYSLMLKHMGGVTSALLHIPSKRTSEEDTMIARYLIRRIAAMKNKRNKVNNNHIVYTRKNNEGMFGTLGYGDKITKNWKNKKCKLHKTVISYLEHFKELGYISDYVVLTKKRAVYGVGIEL